MKKIWWGSPLSWQTYDVYWMSLSHILFGLRFFENVLKTIFRNVLIPESVNFSRRDSVQLLADAQWSYYGTRMKEKRRYDHSLTSYLRKFAKNQFSSDFKGFLQITLQGEVVPHFLLRPCGIIWPLRIRQRRNFVNDIFQKFVARLPFGLQCPIKVHIVAFL